MGVELRAPQQQPPPGSGRRAFALGVLSGALAGACVAAVAASTVVGGGPTPHQGKFAAGLVRPPARREAAAPAVSMQLQNPFARPAASGPVPADPVPAPGGGDESSRREFLKEAAVFTASAATAPALFVGIFGETPPIGSEWQQLPDKSVSPFVGGVFSDPKHKGGTRQLTLDEPEVRDAKGFRRATIKAKGGKDEPAAYTLTAFVGAGGAREKIIIDFSAKGGPKGVEAVYECKGTGNCGISFPDGNFWPKNLDEFAQKKLWAKKKAPPKEAAAAPQ